MRFGSLILLGCVSLSGCTYGPAIARNRIVNLSQVPDSRMMAVLVHRMTVRPPTGFSTFPDGGIEKILSQHLQVYRFDADQQLLQPLAVIEPPEAQRINFEGWLVGWDADQIYLKTSGCAPTWDWNRGCGPQHETAQFFRVNTMGKTELVTALPPALSKGRGSSLAPQHGERNYTRAVVRSQSVEISTTWPSEYRKRLQLDAVGNLAIVGDEDE